MADFTTMRRACETSRETLLNRFNRPRETPVKHTSPTLHYHPRTYHPYMVKIVSQRGYIGGVNYLYRAGPGCVHCTRGCAHYASFRVRYIQEKGGWSIHAIAFQWRRVNTPLNAAYIHAPARETLRPRPPRDRVPRLSGSTSTESPLAAIKGGTRAVRGLSGV